MKKHVLKKIMISGLTAAMILGGTTSAFANSDRGRDSGHNSGHADHRGGNQWGFQANGHDRYQVNIHFSDLNQNYSWVWENIARLASMGVFQGYDDGTFRPQNKITRIEAIVAAVRLMGLQSEAESQEEMGTQLKFKDADVIEKKYPNAVGYVAVALENDLFNETDNKVDPDQPATREWATVLLIKALKLQDEAKKMMNADLPFKDADQIDAGSRGYVALAVQKNLVSGYTDNTFRPDRPVTRAELAALLDRTGDQMPGYNDGAIHGTVAAPVASNVLTLTVDGQTQTLAVDPDAFVFENGVKVALSVLKAGDQVTVRTYNNVIVFIEVTGAAAQPQAFTATVSAAYSGGKITLRNSSNQDAQYTFASNAVIYRNNKAAQASDLQVGDTVFVQTAGNAIQFLQVTVPVNEQVDVNGTLSAVNTTGKYIVVTNSSNQSNVYVLDDNAVIVRDGAHVTLAALQPGDTVAIRLLNNKVVYLGVTAAAQETFTATVSAAYSNGKITLHKSDQDVQYSFASDATIYRNNAEAQPSDIQAGDTVFVQTAGSEIHFLQVTVPVNNQANTSGTISAVNTGSNYIVLTDSGNQSHIYYMGTSPLIIRKGVAAPLSALQAGDEATLQLVNDKVVYLAVTKAKDPVQQFTVDGYFKSFTLNSAGEIASISVTQTVYDNSQVTNYNVAEDVTITGNTANLTAGHAIRLTGENQIVKAIEVK